MNTYNIKGYGATIDEAILKALDETEASND